MDRFKIKIDNKIITKLINICRLCGIDNPQKVQIIEEILVGEIDGDEEPSLVKKIYDLVGIEVRYNDGMPQMACSLCADKINDFYEYKEMCKATNLQTRNLLGLPLEIKKAGPGRKKKIHQRNEESILGDDDEDYKPDIVPPKKQKVGRPTKLSKASGSKIRIDPKPEIFIEDEVKIEDMLAEKEPNKRERIHEQLTTAKPQKKRKVSFPAVDADAQKKIKVENPIVCNVCLVNCRDASDYEIHFYNFHVPHVQSFGCGPCAESFYTLSEQKDHHLWHRLSQTKYNCYKCEKTFDRMAGFSRHICVQPPIFQITEIIPDLKCELCKSVFPTENLYYWHDCFIKKNGECRKCKRHFVKKNILFKHVLHCKAIPPIVDELPVKTTFVITPVTTKTTINISREGGRQKIVKSEPGSILEIEDVSQIEIPEIYLHDELLLKKPVVVLERQNFDKKRRGRPKKIIRTAVVANNSKVIEPLPEQLVLEELPIPEILVPENPTPIISSVTTLGIRIKQEVLNPDYGDFDANLARNIKKERSDEEKRKAKAQKNANTPKPTIKLKIKKEHGTLNASFVEQQQQEAAKEMTSSLPNDVMTEMPNDSTTTAPSTSTDTLPKSIKDKMRTHNKKKRIFKNPFAALAMKIKKERMDPKETISVPVISQVGSAQDLILPKISSVASVRKVQPMVRVKMEKPSPQHEVDYDYEEGYEEEEEEVEEEQENSSVNPVGSVSEETEKENNKSIPEISSLNDLEVPEASSVVDSGKLDENMTKLSPDILISSTDQLVEEGIASVGSPPSPEIENKLEEDRTENILTTSNEEKTVEKSLEENIVSINSVEEVIPIQIEMESIKENVSEIDLVKEIIENNGNSNNFVSDESKTFVENSFVEDESKTSSDVVMEPLQITENVSEKNKKLDFNSKDIRLPLEMSSDVVMAEKPLMNTETDDKRDLNCIESRMSTDVCSDAVMQENPNLRNINLEQESNFIEESSHDVVMGDLTKPEKCQSTTNEEISNSSHPETSAAEMVDETVNEIISSTVKNCEKPSENFNHKIIENHLNFHSAQLFKSTKPTENNLEESQQKESEKIVNNIHDLDDISSSSDAVENMNENNLLVGSPISSEPMSDGEEDKLLNDGCDTNISFGKNNFG